jgi:phosphate:Na+ symporter
LVGLTEIAKLAGGLALFLYGLYRAQSGLRHVAGGRLKAVLTLVTKRPFAASAVGFALTLATQSSSAVAVILVGMVSSRLVGLGASVPALLGADVATTLTVQVLAFEISTVSLLVIAAGALLVLTGGGQSARKYVGDAVLGFGLIFYGMHLMKTAAGPLAGSEDFARALAGMAQHPVLGIIAGMAGTAIIQSSGATVALVLALAQAGALGGEPLASAVPIVLGANIGTAATGLIASLGTTREGKRVALAHIAMKIVAVAIMYPLIGPFVAATASLTRSMGGGTARAVANAHTLFNVGKLLLFLPVAPLFVRLARRILPERPERPARVVRHLADTSKDTPEVVLVKAWKELGHIAERVRELFARALAAFDGGPVAEIEAVRSCDDDTDALHGEVVRHLRGITREELSEKQAAEVERLLYLVRDLEQAGDIICSHLAEEAQEKVQADASFSVEGQIEFRRLGADVAASLGAIERALGEEGDASLLEEVIARESGIDARVRKIQRAHLRREAAGVREAVETDSVFTNAVGELRRLHLVAFNMAGVLLGTGPAGRLGEGPRPGGRARPI